MIFTVGWKELIGKRVLVWDHESYEVREAKVIEVSPSGKYVKLQLLPRVIRPKLEKEYEIVWKKVESISLEDVLEEKK